jgi:hypothetical protein
MTGRVRAEVEHVMGRRPLARGRLRPDRRLTSHGRAGLRPPRSIGSRAARRITRQRYVWKGISTSFVTNQPDALSAAE